MTIFNVTDLHGQLDHLDAVRPAMAAADLLLISGDITNFGDRREAERVLDLLAEVNPRLLAVSGNCDRKDVEGYLTERGVNLNGRRREAEGIWFAGLAGSLPGPGPTPNTYGDDELAAVLEGLKGGEQPFVLVSHQPPFGTAADIVAGGRHVGSAAVREFIELESPVLCLTGHIHESIGTEVLGGCRVVNPGPFSRGRYAAIDIDPRGDVRVVLQGG